MSVGPLLSLVSASPLFYNSATTIDISGAVFDIDANFFAPAAAAGPGDNAASASGGPGVVTVASDVELGGANSVHSGRQLFAVSADGIATVTLPYSISAEVLDAGAPIGTGVIATASLAYVLFEDISSTSGSGSSDIASVFSFPGAGLVADAGVLSITFAVEAGNVIRIDGLFTTDALVVPLPASAPLFLGALIGLATIARRRPA